MSLPSTVLATNRAVIVLLIVHLASPATSSPPEAKLALVPAPMAPDRDNGASGSSMYPHLYQQQYQHHHQQPPVAFATMHPLATLAALAAAQPPPQAPAPLHPLLLATLMGGPAVLPPAASVANVGAGQGHNPLLAYLLAQYMRHLLPQYGAVNYSLPGYSASNNVHNSKVFGVYKYEDRP